MSLGFKPSRKTGVGGSFSIENGVVFYRIRINVVVSPMYYVVLFENVDTHRNTSQYVTPPIPYFVIQSLRWLIRCRYVANTQAIYSCIYTGADKKRKGDARGKRKGPETLTGCTLGPKKVRKRFCTIEAESDGMGHTIRTLHTP